MVENTANDLAGNIQQLLLPKATPTCNWCCIGVRNRMAVGVGGDFFDFVPTNDGCQMIMIGDVTGHNVAASVVMALLYGYIHRSIEEACSPLDVVRRVNSFLKMFSERSEVYDHLFSSTLLFGVIVPETLQMHYVNAAHPPPLIRRGDTLFELEANAPLIGFFDLEDDIVKTFHFKENDRLFLYTDGVSELSNTQGEMFGIKRLKEELKRHKGNHQQFLDDLFTSLRQFKGSAPLQDDCTGIIVDFHMPYAE